MKNIVEPLDDQKREVMPGFSETRRRVLRLPVSIAASIMLGRAGNVFATESEPVGPLDWGAFLKLCLPVADELHKNASAQGQEAYLHWIASMISRARASEIPRAKVGRFGKLEPAVSFGVGYRGKPFFVVEWQLEPRAFLPPHCHPNASVCTVGLDGEARIRNFEIVGQAPEFSSSNTFLVRETHNEIIAPGRINTLSSLRDNIHTFQAGKTGARGIDISTYHGPDVGFSFLQIGNKPRESEGAVYEAVWTGQSV